MEDKIVFKNLLWSSKDASEPISCFFKRNWAYSENYSIHLSNYWEIYILVEGEADRIVEDRCFSVRPYDVVILNPYESHSHRITKRDWYERLYFWIPSDAFAFMKTDPMESLMRENGKGHNLICLPPEKKEALKGLLDVFKQEWSRGDRATELAGFGAFMGILSLLNEHIATLADGQESSASLYETPVDIPPIILDVLRYIEKHLVEDFSEEDIARNFHISAPYLSRLFKNKIKMGLKRYVLLRRVGVAKKVLSSGKSVTEACFECGFNDCSYFIKVFKAYTGVTPYKYQLLSKTRRME